MAALALIAFSTVGLQAQSRGRDLPRGFRSLAGVTLDRDNAATIRAALGNTRERETGAGHDRYTSWCYVPAGRASGVLLELMSDASDLGMPEHELNVIRLRADAPAAEREGCATLPASTPLSTPAGLRLGLTRERVERLLGPPTRALGDSMVYAFDAKEYMRPGTPEYEKWNTQEYRESCFDAGPPYANVGALVIVVFRGARAAEIRLERDDQSVC
ncbi:MAG TPA: hypothetical protein VHB25_10020 [Gemmatimonadaceae bacterium]|nr:hypothetical protein [Gemmatimonadaceae bacterium]